MFRQALRLAPVICKRPAVVGVVRPIVAVPRAAQFSTSFARLNTEPKALIQQELEYEKKEAFDLDPSFVEYMKNENIQAIEPKDNVFCHLVKELDAEKVHVLFDLQKFTFATSEAKNFAAEQEFDQEILEDKSELSHSAEFFVVLEKDGKALQFEVDISVEDYAFFIAGVKAFNKVEDALKYENCVGETDQQYSGPIYENLSVEVQDMFSDLLREKGMDEELGELLVAYSTWKENEMYINWLEKVQAFV
ncbi:hypothetical protein OGAPHI_003867 [Ogataea philodendri]|uniref:Mitochondrial acidic protein MAM33 n=1 Tax=Ogataea philodendri TaxID=1378263 RepID=A0A9P8P670_9ASCO|nr:uncharacterized protein OGAPHI_003867 [Ogataea philodendri]KAH3665679.1 hypothetical protein OGAPHI_003867 [Ogataea philodendri]